MKTFTSFLLLCLATLRPLLGADLPMRPPPVGPQPDAEIVLEWMEVLEECPPDKVCVEGGLHNTGGKTASQVKLEVHIGGTKQSKPRTRVLIDMAEPIMNPGDRQDFMFQLDRRLPYRSGEKMKILEVGKYNFKVLPSWHRPSPKKGRGNKKKR